MKKSLLPALLFSSLIISAQTPPARIIAPGDTLNSIRILPDNRVIFSIYAPGANEITVAGDFLPPGTSEKKLTKADNGIWSLTTPPLKPELYSYVFRANGLRVLDPRNTKIKRDGTRLESMLIVPGTASALYEIRDIPHGNLQKVWYNSPTLELDRRMYVYTPPGYDGKTKYPVLYLLHGAGGDEDAWTTLGRQGQIFDNLIAEGRVKPMVVVMTNGNPTQTAAAPDAANEPRPIGQRASGISPNTPRPVPGTAMTLVMGKFEESLVNDVIPFVEKNYRVFANAKNRAIAGLSMGGGHTAKTVFNHPEMFSFIGIFSGASINPSNEQLQRLKEKKPQLVWVGCGIEDSLLPGSKALSESLAKAAITNKYLETPGGHTWANWRIYLTEIATLFFQK